MADSLPVNDRSRPLAKVLAPLRDFLHTEAAGGVLLLVATAAALLWANSPWQHAYDHFWHSQIAIDIAGHELRLSLQHWVNDGLMTIFFLVVGLEIKREVTTGHLAGRRAATLPVVAAIGGMVVPAVLYVAIAGGSHAHGWGVPMATDIALAVGVMALAGAAAPSSLRAFLLGLAVVDDIGAIVVIAVFYSSGVSFGWLAGAAAAVGVTVVLRRTGVYQLPAYIAVGAFMWFAMHEAGIHPTLAGVLMGLLAPVTPRVAPEFIDSEQLADVGTYESVRVTVQLAKSSVSTVEWLEHHLHPITSYVIVPLFALANAGIAISNDAVRHALHSPITWGIIVGLVVGKPLGVVVAARLAIRARRADAPPATDGRHLLGAGQAAGIGFTVALFIAELAFRDDDGVVNQVDVTDAKMAILVASVASGAVAYLVLRRKVGATAG